MQWSLAEAAGLIRSASDLLQDHEFILRCCERYQKHPPYSKDSGITGELGSPQRNQDSKSYAIDSAKRGLEEH